MLFKCGTCTSTCALISYKYYIHNIIHIYIYIINSSSGTPFPTASPHDDRQFCFHKCTHRPAALLTSDPQGVEGTTCPMPRLFPWKGLYWHKVIHLATQNREAHHQVNHDTSMSYDDAWIMRKKWGIMECTLGVRCYLDVSWTTMGIAGPRVSWGITRYHDVS